ncbi:neuraminidase-like domain-containing protein [Microvirga aerophila]|uniref:Uncharacterized protein n=1 Tax=Microvirga aerophila TaxID=670291 RepID=A0A512BNJ2_9HYPH|nr:neuraminidase-like domain-containing protein [Microvirga aerophila]GEO13531.1 hypothetical protein MAE02_12270 [Microvirga aerophila]
MRVEAFDRDLPSLERRAGRQYALLGDAPTDDEGHFEITYSLESFAVADVPQQGRRPRQKAADLSFRVVGPNSFEHKIRTVQALGRSFRFDEIIFNAPSDLQVLIEVEAVRDSGSSEYERLVALIAPAIEPVALAELTDDDTTFLVHELAAELELTQRIEWLRRSALLERESALPVEAFYGWGRKDLPALFVDLASVPLDTLTRVLERLSATPRDVVLRTLLAAIDENIIPGSLRDPAEDIARRLTRRAQLLRQVSAQLTDDETGAALAGFTVLTFDVSELEENRGLDLTDQNGQFSFDFYTPPGLDDGTSVRRFRFEIHAPTGEKLEHDGTLALDPGAPSDEVRVIRVAMPHPEQDREQELFDEALSEVPEQLRSIIGAHEIRTFAELRHKGGLRRLDSLPDLESAPVRRLDALADLNRISPDPTVAGAVLAKGFDSVASIAAVQSSDFVTKVSGDGISDSDALKLHLTARAQTHVLNNVAIAEIIDTANGFQLLEDEAGEKQSVAPQRCGCSDCEGAVSRAAYLAALLDYAVKHITHAGAAIDVPFLRAEFHQPFDSLPVECHATTKQLLQIRICIEVLRDYLGSRPLTNISKEDALAVGEEAYLVSTYLEILTRLGSSYEEIRRSRGAPQESRSALAGALGIDLTDPRPADPPGDELDRLFLQPQANPTAPHALTEDALEALFGLPSTIRDPLSQGAKFGDDQAQLTRWNLDGVVWNHNTDGDGQVHFTLANPSPGVFRVNVYRDAARAVLVASGEIPSAVGPVRLTPENSSRLSGVVEIAYSTGSASTSIAAVPAFASWRLKRLRTIWREQDHPIDEYSSESPHPLPIIDPDLIGPDDFRHPVNKAAASDPDRAFDLWTARRHWVDKTLDDINTKRRTSGLTAALKQVFGDPLPDLDSWFAALSRGATTNVKAATEEIGKLGMTTEAFLRLMSIGENDRLAALDARNPKPTPQEWSEVSSILTQAAKFARFPVWRGEENAAGVRLGPEEFWYSLTEPREGEWPPLKVASEPLIDPSRLKRADLPDWFAGKAALQIWDTREAKLLQIRKGLQNKRESSGFGAMMRMALGRPSPGNPLPHNLDTLNAQLSGGGEDDRQNAIDKIQSDLLLTVPQFQRLMVVKLKSAQSDPARKPTAAEWAEVYDMLTPARKVLHEYPGWVSKEAAVGLFYWRALKARLPLWRAAINDRSLWRRALRQRSRMPIVDPNVIGVEDLAQPLPGTAAFDVWKDRRAKWTSLRDDLRAAREAKANPLAGFDKIVTRELGVSIADLELLEQRREAGFATEKQQEQFGLTNAAFNFLMRIRALLKTGQPLIDSEWSTVYDTLAHVTTRRRSAVDAAEERVAGILLSSDHFVLATVLKTPLAFIEISTPPWLAAWNYRREWQETLRSRLGSEQSVSEALTSAVRAVEGSTLLALRAALIAASDAVGASPEERAEWITQRLLIDARAGVCQSSTRVGQMIETVQTLIFGLRTGQFKPLEQLPLKLVSDEFDEEWKWLGSYATWRAAMFVFLYPENILAPVLLRPQTPAFAQLIQGTRATRLSPDQACHLARSYTDYFADVCSLEIEATCQAEAQMYAGEGCDRTPSAKQSMLFMFGCARGGKVYWSSFDAHSSPARAQTPWQEVPGLSNIRVVRIVGAHAYYRRAPAEAYGGTFGIAMPTGFASVLFSHIYLFCITSEAGRHALRFAKLRLDDFGAWEGDAAELPMPPGGFSSLSEIHVVQTQNVFQPPELVFRHRPERFVYYRRLNVDGKEWENSGTDWQSFYYMFNQFNGRLSLDAVLRVNSDYLWFVTTAETGNLGLELQLVELRPGNQIPGVSRAWFFGSAEFKGALPGPDDYGGGIHLPTLSVSSIYFFWRDSSGSRYRRFTSLHGDEVNNPMRYALADLIQVVRHSGDGPDGAEMVAYKRERNGRAFYAYKYTDTGGAMVGSSTVQVVPRVTSPLSIPQHLTGQQLQQRRQQIATGFSGNKDAPPPVLMYLHEAYYFVPLQLALSLQSAGQFVAALDWFRTIYDFEAEVGPPNLRNIYFGLELDAMRPLNSTFHLAEGWLLDPLNPHAIAATRRYAYTRFTICSLVQCLLEFADSEFSRDDIESLARSRTLYLTALDLLSLPELKQKLGICNDLIGQLVLEPGIEVPPEVPPAIQALLEDLTQNVVITLPFLVDVVTDLKNVLSSPGSWDLKLQQAKNVVGNAVAAAPIRPSLGELMTAEQDAVKARESILLTRPALDARLLRAVNGMVNGVDGGTPLSADPAAAVAPLASSPAAFQFCVPPNPMLTALRLHAELNLAKLRSCRNIAGIRRDLDPYTAPVAVTTSLGTDGLASALSLPGIRQIRPTLYRFSVLIERAKQLIQLAAYMETSMLAALEKRDAEAYNLLRARHDLGVAEAHVRVRKAEVIEARNYVTLAELQRDRAQIQIDTYENWIQSGYLESETNYLNALEYIGDARRRLLGYASSDQVLSGYSMDPVGTIFKSVASAMTIMTNPLNRTVVNNEIAAQRYAFQASHERRVQEWQLQQSLAQQDYRIGEQQVRLAGDGVTIATQQQVVAELETSNAEDTIEFLNGKFANRELYDWMSGVLEGVYRFFLQQATTVARLAEIQLAFERQEIVPTFIKNDYWTETLDSSGTQATSKDRKGLTGSARLLQDTYQLDQHAFESNKIKLQLTKTLSLFRIAPLEFQRFLETGLLPFATTNEMFDRDFPGHYLRLIRRVRVSVIALIPPTRGVCATLSNSGLSRAVIGRDVFQSIPIQRDPESVALTSPTNATGLFELDPISSEMLLPFEGIGVHTSWEFCMPRASNAVDYRTIADILVTIEYTALNSAEYGKQVRQALGRNLSADRTFSLRSQFADQWYDLHNPAQTKTPMTVRFRTVHDDFPPNVEGVLIQHVILYFVRLAEQPEEAPVATLRYSAAEEPGTVGGPGTPIDGVISTRRGNAGSWTSMIGKPPIGEWELSLPNTEAVARRFINEDFADILLILTYSGQTPPWPE